MLPGEGVAEAVLLLLLKLQLVVVPLPTEGAAVLLLSALPLLLQPCGPCSRPAAGPSTWHGVEPRAGTAAAAAAAAATPCWWVVLALRCVRGRGGGEQS